HLRARSPAQANLRDNLRNLLTRNQEFKVWKNGENRTLCGLVAWSETEPGLRASFDSENVERIVRQVESLLLSPRGRSRVPLAELVAQIFNLSGHPIDLDSLVETVANLLNIRDYKTESLDQSDTLIDGLISPVASPDAGLRGRELLQQFWNELRRLPMHQRNAICLGFADQAGEDLFSLLLDRGIATQEQLCEEFGLKDVEFNALWEMLPILDNTVLA